MPGPFDFLSAGGAYDPALGMLMMQQPDAFASAAAAAGIPPPTAPTTTAPPLGEVIEPIPMPRERPTTAPRPEETPASTTAPGGGASLAQTLRGVAAPKGPEIQKITTPHAPQPHGTIQQNQLLQLLLSGAGGAPNLSLFGRR